MALKFSPSAEQLWQVTGKPLANIKKSLPGIYAALDKHGLQEINEVIAALATIATEGPFLPINEYGGPKYWSKYDGRADLGNSQPGDGIKFHGRGFIQLTGRANYLKYGQKVGVDLIADPDKANDPVIAAEILALYLKDHGVDVWANRGHFLFVRMKVNGGTNGWEYFGGTKGVVWKLLSLAWKR